MLVSWWTTLYRAENVCPLTLDIHATYLDAHYAVLPTIQCAATVYPDILQVEVLNVYQIHVTFKTVTCVYRITVATSAWVDFT